MNNKMAISSIYQQWNIKKSKLSKQEERRENHEYNECFDGCHVGGGCQGMGEEVRGLSTNR